MMKKVLVVPSLIAAVLLPATASAKDQVLVCRGGPFRLIVNAKDKGPVLAAKFKKYSTANAFVKATSGVHKGKYPYHTLKPGRCAILDGKFAKKAETHFAYFAVKNGLGAYKRTALEKMLFGPAYLALAGGGGSFTTSCMQNAVKKYYKVK